MTNPTKEEADKRARVALAFADVKKLTDESGDLDDDRVQGFANAFGVPVETIREQFQHLPSNEGGHA